jgi:two-component system, chemotaxis family, CheB/CheR fusion protein
MLERTLAFEFQARTHLAYRASGIQCTIRIPLTRRVFQVPVVDSG